MKEAEIARGVRMILESNPDITLRDPYIVNANAKQIPRFEEDGVQTNIVTPVFFQSNKGFGSPVGQMFYLDIDAEKVGL